MPPDQTEMKLEKEFFEELFQQEYQKLLRYASIVLRKYGARHVSVSGRSEDVVQETFQTAWRKRGELMQKEFPTGWIYVALVCKAREALREDRAWVRRMSLLPQRLQRDPAQELAEDLVGLLPKEEYKLLSRLYLEGYTYKELCEEMDVKKSTLAMRVKRSKEKILEFYKNFEI